jgi:hypothetical protein
MADNLSVESTRKAHSISVGEVSTRTHQQGESEDHFESSSREFSNPNHCHAITFLFYRINKIETIKFEIVAIERRVLDPVAPTPVLANPIRSVGQIATVPQEVPATNSSRLAIEARGLQSEQQYAQAGSPGLAAFARFGLAGGFQPGPQAAVQLPISDAARKAALDEADKQLAARGLIDPKTGKVSTQVQVQFGFERQSSLPTAGIIVKGCLDDCDVCEPELKQKMQLELDHLALKNKLLQRQIDLLDKSQEYRCCPPGEVEEVEASA